MAVAEYIIQKLNKKTGEWEDQITKHSMTEAKKIVDKAKPGVELRVVKRMRTGNF